MASAVLFIPTAVFADKGDHGKQQTATEHNSPSAFRDKHENRNMSERTNFRNNDNRRSVKQTYNRKYSTPRAHQDNRSEKRVQNRRQQTDAQKTNPSQQKRRWNTDHQNVPQRKWNAPETQKGGTTKSIHIEKPLHKPEIKSVKAPFLPKKPAGEEIKKTTSISVSSKSNAENTKRNQTVQVPIDRPLEKVPDNPDAKVIPMNSGQSSSHSSQSTDGGMGTPTIANIKASLALPIIFNDGEKVLVYFSRLDLLRSQWVNAPPSKPPKSALLFFR
jgi:hypothetical protein